MTIDGGTGSPAAPSARAQVTAQSAFATKLLTGTFSQVCMSMSVNVTTQGGTAIDLLRLRTAANGPVAKVYLNAQGTLLVRSDVAGTQQSSSTAIGTGWHEIELCGTVGAATTWDLYRDGTRIVNAWAANTGTTPVGLIQIGDNAAHDLTMNFDHVRVDQAPVARLPRMLRGRRPRAGAFEGHSSDTEAPPSTTSVRETDTPLDLEARHGVGVIGVPNVTAGSATDRVVTHTVLGREATIGPRPPRDAVSPTEIGQVIDARPAAPSVRTLRADPAEVRACPTERKVTTSAGHHEVAPRPADEPVAAGVAEEVVVAVSPSDQVVPQTTSYPVVASEPTDHVATVGSP